MAFLKLFLMSSWPVYWLVLLQNKLWCIICIIISYHESILFHIMSYQVIITTVIQNKSFNTFSFMYLLEVVCLVFNVCHRYIQFIIYCKFIVNTVICLYFFVYILSVCFQAHSINHQLYIILLIYLTLFTNHY